MKQRDLDLLIFSFDYPPNDGGISRLCGELASQCSTNADAALVLTQRPSDSAGVTPPQIMPPPITEIRVTNRRPLREWESLQILREYKEVPVISAIWYPEGLIATLAGVRPRIILAHGTELTPTRSLWRRAAWRKLQRWVLEAADLVVANSEYTGRLVEKAAPGSNVSAIPLGVDTRKFCPGDRKAAKARFGVEGTTVVTTVSRLHEYKGHDVVLEALAAIPEKILSGFTYLIAGKGPERSRLEERAIRLGLETTVRWLDYVSDEDLPDLYRASDLFVLCTRESMHDVEGFGLAFLEAQACATPVVGTRTGGIPDSVIEGEGGWLIEQDDSRHLVNLLTDLATDPQRFRFAGLQARARVERHCTWEQYARRLAAAANAVMPEQRRPAFVATTR